MQRARAAIVVLRKVESGGTIGDEHVSAIADLADTFDWLDESKQLLAIEYKAALSDLETERRRASELAAQLSNSEQVAK